MDKLLALGTGNGAVLNCYNTCFSLKKDEEYFIVDGGGGNQILNNLNKLDIELSSIHNIFLSHNHIDHIVGVLWLIRVIGVRIARNREYEGDLNIYASDESMKALTLLVNMLAPDIVKKIWGTKIILHIVEDKQEVDVLGSKTVFFDIKAKKEKQFGFKIAVNNNKYLSFLGDEPYNNELYNVVKDSDYLIHESFCLEEEKEAYHPHEKGHCTVKEASENAKSLNAKNLILWHTMDNDLKNRKELYTNEAKQYYNGNIYVPDDLEVIKL